MCRLFLSNKAGLDRLGPQGVKDLFEILEVSMGGHGNGVAYIKNGKLYLRKGTRLTVKKVAELAFEQGIEWFIFHTRWASVGSVSNRNCHPFRHGRIVAAMNGTETGLKSLSRAMGGITDTEASVISIASISTGLPPEEVAKRFNELNSVFVGFVKEKNGYVPFASVGSLLGDLQVYVDDDAIIMASELPLKDQSKIMDALEGFYWAGGPMPEEFLIHTDMVSRRKKRSGIYYEYPEDYDYYYGLTKRK
ncbi:glutamine amidotransferase, class-II [Desulforamulus reducens MI-1]|uniref:Glutamine amidotransferase, class-II n=1 Tax=Desulforamulus reducens (strain ATCC BAA-1160 / DSM 100696 / MI-1) TaxID=349161 RepID=A4J2U0_DESRM|nr:hypothetical protein [Desulforamulus reducens]ABO49393.1 glutamine amidotransferase, class-II [Desulforamulus reducens MI-1]